MCSHGSGFGLWDLGFGCLGAFELLGFGFRASWGLSNISCVEFSAVSFGC